MCDGLTQPTMHTVAFIMEKKKFVDITVQDLLDNTAYFILFLQIVKLHQFKYKTEPPKFQNNKFEIKNYKCSQLK